MTLDPQEIEGVVADLRVAYFFAKQKERTILTYYERARHWIGLSVSCKIGKSGATRCAQAVCQLFLEEICGVTEEPSIRRSVSIKRIEYAHSLSYQAKMRTILPIVSVESPSTTAE